MELAVPKSAPVAHYDLAAYAADRIRQQASAPHVAAARSAFADHSGARLSC